MKRIQLDPDVLTRDCPACPAKDGEPCVFTFNLDDLTPPVRPLGKPMLLPHLERHFAGVIKS